ncbi:adenylate guanylate cyclase with integral membrane sensor [Leptolyngbya sp. Heron Island J]|uniref:adenylate/guanylate cyclase domain-containing protein n=1 Tax=Leptolyngbya sp. Heron Island J TaxID=1385935 RepID=UPI0003B973C6|nr:adenylate/guanylate cyclase domain-containing protein [Leptolyngbya sp. Heron Island J]ESA32399.1 adenylate guanylate cyclase with integral membrane sensor [Leptolyngbya sp. Heron Island J]
MVSVLQTSLGLLKSRLSRKIVTSIFLSLVVIEFVVFIPSYRQRRADKLRELETLSQEVIATIKANVMLDMLSTSLLVEAQTALKTDSIILGAVLYSEAGELIDSFGEMPSLGVPASGLSRVETQLVESGTRYDVAWPSQQFQDRYILVIRHDANSVKRYMVQYSLLILLIVIIIAAFVTLVTIFMLERMLINPLLLLRDDLCQAAAVVDRPQIAEFKSLKHVQQDELGEVIRAFAWMFGQISQEVQERQAAEIALRGEQEKTEALLRNVLPVAIANRLKNDLSNRTAIASRFENVTILFADIVGFTQLAAKTAPTDLVCQLNDIFSIFDALAERHGLEKIKTIGDAYMVVGGVPAPMENHAAAVMAMAIDMQAAVQQHPFKLRIGINTGPVVAGVIGKKKFSYDLWGDAVNIASRMESHGVVGRIQVSADTYELLKAKYSFEDRGCIDIKGRGQARTYLWLPASVHTGEAVIKTTANNDPHFQQSLDRVLWGSGE